MSGGNVGLSEPPLVTRIRASVIGGDRLISTPYGARRVTYADYTASGRALTFIEDFVRDEVLPLYANTHTEASGTGRQTTWLREGARNRIRDALGGGDDVSVIFCGSGSTAAIDKLIGILGIRLPADLDDRYCLRAAIPEADRPVVLVGPFEHHSNEISWRETIADVVVIPEDANGHVDLDALEDRLVNFGDRRRLIGSFSAASNVTGIVTDIAAVAEILHRHGAMAFFDFAAAAPYSRIDMQLRDARESAYIDAVFISPHKFIGGPQTPGILAVRTELLTNRVPVTPGGGSVSYVSPERHRYVTAPEHREEAGTPAIVESIRAGLVFDLQQAVGIDVIRRLEDGFIKRAVKAWSAVPNLTILGDLNAERLSIVSFVVRSSPERYLHHNFVVALLNDLFGIQARGGCSCAGPYGHRLLGIDLERSRSFETAILAGCEGVKPGWVRVNFNYFLSEREFDYLLRAVELVARYGAALLAEYLFEPETGLWRHRVGAPEPPLRFAALGYDANGQLTYPDTRQAGDESLLAGHLEEAEALLVAAQAARQQSGPDGALPTEAETLRWFELPARCLDPAAV